MEIEGILFVHYHYPPMHNGGVYRNYYMSHALVDNHAENSWVLTTDNVKLFAQDELPISHKIKIEQIFTFDYRTIIAKLFASNSVGGSQLKEENKQSRMFQFAIKMQRSFPFVILLGEGSIFYIINAYIRACRLIRKERISIVYSSFMPYADHLIAWLLKKKFTELIWIADFRDLHVEPIYKNTLWPSFQKKFEKYLLRNASLVTTVSDGLRDKLTGLHPNVHTITKGVSVMKKVEKYKKFTIAYTGSLFLDFRNPGSIFEHLELLLAYHHVDQNDIQFVYAGKDGNKMREMARSRNIEHIFVDLGYISHASAKELQCRSHINLLLTSASHEHQGVLTGKFFEYIEAGNLIVCVINGHIHDSEFKSMFDRYNLGTIWWQTNDTEWQIRELALWYIEWKEKGEIEFEMKTELIQKEMGWAVQAQKLLAAIEKN